MKQDRHAAKFLMITLQVFSSFTAHKANQRQQRDGFTWFTLWFPTSIYFSGCSFKNNLIFDALYFILFDEHRSRDAEVIEVEWETFDDVVLSNESLDDKSFNSIITIKKKRINSQSQINFQPQINFKSQTNFKLFFRLLIQINNPISI